MMIIQHRFFADHTVLSLQTGLGGSVADIVFEEGFVVLYLGPHRVATEMVCIKDKNEHHTIVCVYKLLCIQHNKTKNNTKQWKILIAIGRFPCGQKISPEYALIFQKAPVDQWVKICVVFEHGEFTVYWNGVRHASVSILPYKFSPNTHSATTLGFKPNYDPFFGYIDDVRLTLQ